MKNLLIPIVAAFALVTGSAVAQEKTVLVTDDQKTYTVEVVSADPTAKTLTIKSDRGPSTLLVTEKALGGLQTVKPGDKISITVRDEATGQRRMVTAFMSGAVTSKPPVSAEKTVIVKQTGTPVEFINVDPAAKKITVLSESGNRQTFRVDENAMVRLSDVKPGQKVFLSYRFDKQGKPEAVVRVGRASDPTSVVRIDPGASVEVVSADPLAKTLTIRTESGDRQTLFVDEKAVVNLKDLRAGETILVTLEGDKVVLVTRKQ